MFAKSARYPECQNCKGDQCPSVKCDEALFPVLDRKLDALFAWKKWMCNRTESDSRTTRKCHINGMVIFERTADANCNGCIYR